MWTFRSNPFRHDKAHYIRSAEPYWLLRNGIGDARGALETSMDCDIAVIGAGITGALVTDALLALGGSIVVLDRRDVGQGSTSASTALLQYEIDAHLLDLGKQIGPERAVRAYRAGVDSFELLEARMPELLPLADYERRESLYLASNEKSVPDLKAEAAARRGIGIQVDWLDAAELLRRYGVRRPGGMVSTPAAQIDPFRLTRALFSGCVRHGARLFARTQVTGITEVSGKLVLKTEKGPEVRATHVVVCAGFESLDFVPIEVAQLSNTFALVTEPLPAGERVERLPLIWESARPYLYLRGTPDNRLLVGGEDVPFKSALARDALLPRQVGRLKDSYEDLFGRPMPPVAHAWAGSFASTRDALPYIGAVPRHHPNLRYALCYGGNGITYSVLAGEMLRASIAGTKHSLDDIFGFGRLDGSANSEIAKQGGSAQS